MDLSFCREIYIKYMCWKTACLWPPYWNCADWNVQTLAATLFPLLTGQSYLIGSPQPIIALAGDDVILPCRLEPPISASSRAVEWTKPGLDPEYIHVHQDGRLVYQSQNPLYKYRTALFVDQLINGNVTLKLFSVKISDAGRYKCFLPSLWKEAFIQLNVGKSDTVCLRRFWDASVSLWKFIDLPLCSNGILSYFKRMHHASLTFCHQHSDRRRTAIGQIYLMIWSLSHLQVLSPHLLLV